MKTIMRHTIMRRTSYAILGRTEDHGNPDRHKRRSKRAIVCLRAQHPLTLDPSAACRPTAMTAAPSG
jgi:hypothetical protein